MTAGSKLVAYRLNTKTGEYIMVNDKSYTVSDKGTVSITMTNNRTYALVTEKKAKSINKVIKATVKPAKSTITVKAGKTAVIKLSTKLNTANVKSITYTSSKKSVATVGKNGKVTAKKAGTTTIKIEVTLKNGSSKTVKTVVKVTSKS
jgi:mannan endo-1,4-beta-mannosidase